MNIEQIKQLIEGRTVKEILKESLQKYLQTKADELSTLNDLYNQSEYRRITEPISYFEDSIADVKEHWNEYEWLHETLSDEKSKATLCDMLAAKITMDTTYIEHAFSEENIYFDRHIWGRLAEETYVDCGAFDGDTVLKFVAVCPTYKKIYICEAVHEVMQRCKNNLEVLSTLPNSNCCFIERAVSNEEKDLRFDIGSMQGESKVSEGGSLICKAFPLDKLRDKITFIKMDIEGSEQEAIAGAHRIIREYTPKMAICIYHRVGDFWKIPRQVLEINPNYVFKMRHHDYEVYSETVLYCVPKERVNNLDEVEIADRTSAALRKLHIFSAEEYENWLQHGKDKKWFLRQLSSMDMQIRKTAGQCAELQTYISVLETGKAYLEQQVAAKDARINELEQWDQQLEAGKAYLEQQVAAKDARINELEQWAQQLEDGKAYLEDQVAKKDTRIDELEKWCQEVTAGKEYVEAQWHAEEQRREADKQRIDELVQQLNSSDQTVNNIAQ